ncbi:hypothetical protein APR41_12000 [Salegentibacter salinarum]|uniref:Methyltransferase FkbM domain-containing protein n=1 Tax=Salegentibacter salinarum TaxID=447422 RepID=A0A2N0U297_9FLAO|nr:FkbM family methyltransferase [Salegentibacter salinarum]PKD21131.1 hypothetical protein APR41_12000 [Salegentibacter salinarum]SKB76291.1 methyltransferase, FkbM family [Salegentibacter salinarum]
MKKIKNFLTSKFLRIYAKLPTPVQRSICSGIKQYCTPSSKIKKLNFQGEFTVKLTKNNHFKMYNYGGMIEHETFWEGPFETFENDLGWIWIELCQFSEVILDIGANTGIYSLVAKSIKPEICVYAFEPSIHTFKRLKSNNKINNFDIKCEQIAVSNFTGKQTFFDLPYPNDNASLSPDKMKNWQGYKGKIMEYEVETTTIKDYINKNKLEGIDLIKIDIEMHEPEALMGLGEYLNKFKPVLIIEVLSKEIAQRLNELINFEDFHIFHLKKNRQAEKLDRFIVTELDLKRWEWNYIIFHKDQTEKIRTNTSLFNTISPV